MRRDSDGMIVWESLGTLLGIAQFGSNSKSKEGTFEAATTRF